MRIVDGHAVDGNTHKIKAQRILRRNLASQPRDINTLVVVEYGQFVIDDFNRNMRGFTEYKARVDDVFRMHVAAPFVFALCRLELHVLGDALHGATRAGSRKADVITVNSRSPA